MKSILIFSILFSIYLSKSYSQWTQFPTENAIFTTNSATTFSVKIVNEALSYNDLQLFSQNSFGISTSKMYQLIFTISSTKNCTLRIRFGDFKFDESTNYLLNVPTQSTITPTEVKIGPFETGTTLYNNLHLYFQAESIPQGTQITVTNIRMEEFKKNIETPMNTTLDSVIFDLMGAPFRSDKYAVDNGWQQYGQHEGQMALTIPDNDWEDGSRPRQWLNNNQQYAITAWGEAIIGKTGSTEQNIRIQVRNHLMYIYSNGKWQLVENIDTNPEGELFLNNSYERSGINMVINSEIAEDGGGFSFEPSNLIMHWWRKSWPINRVALPANYDGIYIRCEMRLKEKKGYNPNYSNTNIYAGIGADYYIATDSKGQIGSPGLAQMRHKRITKEWRVFNLLIVGDTPPVSIPEYISNIRKLDLPPYVLNSNVGIRENSSVEKIGIFVSKNKLTIKNAPFNAKLSISTIDGKLILSKSITSGSDVINFTQIHRIIIVTISDNGHSLRRIIQCNNF